MYLKLFSKPFVWLVIATYLSYWSSNAAQKETSAMLKPLVDSVALGAAYFSVGLLALSAFGFLYGGYRIWRWQNGEIPFCSRCGSMLEIRNGRHGEFWGCMSYPRCRGSEDI